MEVTLDIKNVKIGLTYNISIIINKLVKGLVSGWSKSHDENLNLVILKVK